MKAPFSLTVTLDGAAAKDVAQLASIDIPDLWHLAHSKQLFPSDADRDAMLTIWRIAHHLKRTLTQQFHGPPKTQQKPTNHEGVTHEGKRKCAVPKQRRRKSNK